MNTTRGTLTRNVTMTATFRPGEAAQHQTVKAGTTVNIIFTRKAGWVTVRVPGTLFSQLVTLAAVPPEV